MRASIILVGGFLVAMAIAIGFAFVGESESLETPKIRDIIEPVDTATINPNPDADILEIVESVELELDTNEYWIDEDGKKHFTINAVDTPIIED